MGGIIDKITEFIKELLQGWVLTNFETMFTDVNDKVGTIAGEVSKTPSTWNSGIFDMIKTLSDNVMIPIAGMIISFVLVYELISMVIDKNNLHDFNTAIFIRFFMKACIAVMLLSKTFDIVMAVFDVGSHIVNSAAAAISGETSIDVSSTLQTMFNEQFSEMSIGELLGLGMETMIVSLCMKIMSVLITVILYGRMIEIYLYVSVAPVPCATVTNREWGTIGTNYFKGLCALGISGIFYDGMRCNLCGACGWCGSSPTTCIRHSGRWQHIPLFYVFHSLRQVHCRNLSGMRTKGGTIWQYPCRCQRICPVSRQKWH